ncbi:hypothetical protein N9W89_10410 [Hellea sp.]|nr:hypothetical protein [Hellea sp.]
MAFLKGLVTLFLLPGTLVLGAMNISVENDGGVFRSLINMIFWGFVGVIITLPLMLG